jgi:hypothetical protein
MHMIRNHQQRPAKAADHHFAVRRRVPSFATVLGAALLAVATAGITSAPAFASGWVMQPTPEPSGATSAVLTSVSCGPVGGCTAVGHSANSSGVSAALAEQWSGTSWTITLNQLGAAGGSSLSGVSCGAANACVAVGQANGAPLAEGWDGTRWTPIPTSSGTTTGSLYGVSCGPAGCMAVGQSTGTPLAEWWNGSSWSTLAVPLPTNATGGLLSGVSCTTATSCTAVGSWTYRYCVTYPHSPPLCVNRPATLAEGWNGATWSVEPTPSPGIGALSGKAVLSGVSCASATSCVAVGMYVGSVYGTPLVQESFGATWADLQPPAIPPGSYPTFSTGGSLSGASCTTATCTVVGHGNGAGIVEVATQPVELGTAWALEPTPSPSSSALSGVSCPSTTACEAVGSYAAPSGSVTLAEGYAG